MLRDVLVWHGAATEPGDNAAAPTPPEDRLLRSILALLPPLVALSVQLALRPAQRLPVWLLIYPAVFLSSWIGGLRAAVVASVFSATAVLWLLVPPTRSFAVAPAHYLAAGVVVTTGILFGLFHDRLRRANQRVAHAFGEAEQARRELQRANEALASLVDQAPEGIFVADLDGRYTEVNRAGCRMLGRTREQILGKTILELVPEERAEQLQRERVQLARGQDVVSEWVLRKSDGAWLPVEVSAKVLPDGRWQAIVRDISERKRLEAALQATNADLVRAQSVAEVGSWRLDVRQNVLHWSDEEYKMFGVAPGTPMTYEAFLGRVHPDDRAYVDREWTAALRGEPYDIEHRVVVDGAVRWVREKADLEFDEQHVLVGGIGVTLHITERKRREQELRDAQERLELALRGADLALWDWNVASGEVVFNPRWAEMRGYRPDEVRGHVDSWTAGVHPDDWPRVQKTLEDYFAGRRAEYETEHRVRTRSGEWIWILDRGKVFVRDERGQPLRMVGTELDITARKRLEDEQQLLSEAGAILASTLELEATLTSIGRLTTRSLADFCILYVVDEGGAARRLKAFSRDPAHEWLCEQLARLPLDRSRASEIWSELDANRSVLLDRVSPEMVEAFSQGEEHLRALRTLDPKSIIVAPLFVHGKLLGAMSLVARAPSRAYSRDDVRFAEQIAQRAAYAVDNAQLYAAARRAIRARDGVLGVVAHDLRNPLGTILMQAVILQRHGGASDDRVAKSAGSIARSGKRMNRIIQDLLDVTRIDEGRLSVEQGRVSAREVLAESVEAQGPLARAASLELELEVEQDLPEVWADRDRLLQIFENLIGNAVKFTPAGGVVRVGAAPRDGEVLFWVVDTGAGIGAENLPHVFDRFWQGHGSERRGVGLGLAIVKGLVEAHHGRIWVESTLDRGASFFFTIPTPPRA